MLISFLYKYGILATCVAILVEYACFPISSEIVLPLSGAITRLNNFNLVTLIFLSVICGLIGSLFCYFIGRFLGSKCTDFLIKKFPKSKKAFDYSFDFFDKYGKKAVLIARLIPLCRTYISFISGILRQPILSFIIYSAIGIVIWNSILLSIGFYLGSKWHAVVYMYDNYKYIIFVIICIIIGILVCRHNSKQKNAN